MDQTTKVPEKRWFTDGPTMTFPGRERAAFWTVTLLLYILLNMFVLRLSQGTWLQLQGPYDTGPLIPNLLAPLNIFQFPIQIIVVALLFTMLCTVPILLAQLYSLLHTIPFILAVFFMAHNPILSLCLFVSCAAVSFEPMRFKSRFVSAVVCLLPVVLYWTLYSGENPEQNILRWAVLYSPWALAFLLCLVVIAIVLAIGHFLRNRPGIVMPVFAALLAATVLLFHHQIGLNERDFRADVYRYHPDQMREFQGYSIAALLEEELTRTRSETPYLPDDMILERLRSEWRWAFFSPLGVIPVEQQESQPSYARSPVSQASRAASEFRHAQLNAIDHIDRFIATHSGQTREADAIYYRALLLDIKVDWRQLRDDDILHFYHGTPSPHSEYIWRDLLERFPLSPVAVEARWRLARLLAARQPKNNDDAYHFKEALDFLTEAQQHCRRFLQQQQEEDELRALQAGPLAAIFTHPPPTITNQQLKSLRQRIGHLTSLIAKENRTGHLRHEARLAAFVDLDPHELNYEQQLTLLKLDSPQPDPLIDNIELALTLLERDPHQRIIRLTELTEQYPDRDGGIEARLELALALIEERNRIEDPDEKAQLLDRSRAQLNSIINAAAPDAFFAEYAQNILDQIQ